MKNKISIGDFFSIDGSRRGLPTEMGVIHASGPIISIDSMALTARRGVTHHRAHANKRQCDTEVRWLSEIPKKLNLHRPQGMFLSKKLNLPADDTQL